VDAHRPFVIMLAGVNGSGKTTSIGKLAHYYQERGKSVLLAAGDTFRAAAREQLAAWGERNNVTVISQQSGDAAAVIYDAINAAQARGIDVVLADTAGRLPTQLHLMEEIRKVKRVIARRCRARRTKCCSCSTPIPAERACAGESIRRRPRRHGARPHQAGRSARGGVIAAIAHMRSGAARDGPIPLRFIGVGEGLDDLRPFDADEFVGAFAGMNREAYGVKREAGGYKRIWVGPALA
jgi:fused signal recognition particle receptor